MLLEAKMVVFSLLLGAAIALGTCQTAPAKKTTKRHTAKHSKTKYLSKAPKPTPAPSPPASGLYMIQPDGTWEWVANTPPAPTPDPVIVKKKADSF